MKEQLKDAQDEVLREIGRNLLLYQYIESQLKLLLAKTNISGYASLFQQQCSKYMTDVQRQTMGQLVRSFVEEVYTREGKEDRKYAIPEKLTEIWTSISFNIDGEKPYIERRQQLLANMVTDRNTLAHHFLLEHDISSIKGCQEALDALKQQRDNAVQELDELEKLAHSINQLMTYVSSFLGSTEGEKYWQLVERRTSRLAMLLEEVVMHVARPDGWAVVLTAEQHIRRHAPKELEVLQKYGHNTLATFIVETELFDILEEGTAKGGVRVLYRKKPDPTLERTFVVGGISGRALQDAPSDACERDENAC